MNFELASGTVCMISRGTVLYSLSTPVACRQRAATPARWFQTSGKRLSSIGRPQDDYRAESAQDPFVSTWRASTSRYR